MNDPNDTYMTPRALKPVHATVYFENPETDPSEFPRCTVRPEGGFLIINDLTTTPRKAHLIPAERIDCVTVVELIAGAKA